MDMKVIAEGIASPELFQFTKKASVTACQGRLWQGGDVASLEGLRKGCICRVE